MRYLNCIDISRKKNPVCCLRYSLNASRLGFQLLPGNSAGKVDFLFRYMPLRSRLGLGKLDVNIGDGTENLSAGAANTINHWTILSPIRVRSLWVVCYSSKCPISSFLSYVMSQRGQELVMSRGNVYNKTQRT